MNSGKTSSGSKIRVVPASLWYASTCGKIAAETYVNEPLMAAAAPYRAKYYNDYERTFIQRSWKRMLDPRNLTFVAVTSPSSASADSVMSIGSQDEVVGYTQLIRMGSDTGAKRQLASRNSLWLRLLGWLFWTYSMLPLWIVGRDRSQDPQHHQHRSEVAEVMEQMWNTEERKNQWYTQSLVVRESWQGKGIGKMLMAEVIARAEEEGVIIGLEASGPGQVLYKKLGFDTLPLPKQVLSQEGQPIMGSCMIYYPKSRRAGE